MMSLGRNVSPISIALVSLLLSVDPAEAQSPCQGELALGFVRTDLDSSGVEASVLYAPSIGELFSSDENGYWTLSPDIEFRNGSEGAFDSIVLKLTAIRCQTSSTVSPSGTHMLRDYATFFPISAGIETDRSFTTVNAMGEIGCVPWFGVSSTGGFLRHLAEQAEIGVYIQGGYKFSSAIEDSTVQGNLADGTEEEPNSGLLRIRGSVSLLDHKIVKFDLSNGISLLGSADAWFDTMNSEFYARLTGGLRIDLSGKLSLNLKYENGSGAPSFNRGSQFGIGLGFSY